MTCLYNPPWYSRMLICNLTIALSQAVSQSIIEIRGQVPLGKEFLASLSSSLAIIACPLYSCTEGGVTMFHSPAQCLTKAQNDALRKAKRQEAKAAKKQRPVGGIGDHQMEEEARHTLEGVLVLLVHAQNGPRLSELAHSAASALHPKPVQPIAWKGTGHRLGGLEQPAEVSAGVAVSVEEQQQRVDVGPMYFLALDGSDKNRPGTGHAACEALLSLKQPIICADAKGFLRDLSKAGVVVPAASGINMNDPCVLDWLLEPEQVIMLRSECCNLPSTIFSNPQEDDRDSKHYSLESVAQRMGLSSLVSYQQAQALRQQGQQLLHQFIQPTTKGVQGVSTGKKSATVAAAIEASGLGLMPPAMRLVKGLLATAVLFELISKKLATRPCRKAIQLELKVQAKWYRSSGT